MRGNIPDPTDNLQGTYNLLSLRSSEKTTCGQFTELPTSTSVMKQVTAMALSKKQNEGLIFENRTGAKVNDILTDDEESKEYDKIDGNITGVDWEAELQETKIQEPAAHMPQLNNNEYASLAGEEDYDDNDTESTGVENNCKITGVRHKEKTTGVDSDNYSTESGSTGAVDKSDELALIKESTAEAERDNTEGNDLIAGT